jgi:hypothetical protein
MVLVIGEALIYLGARNVREAANDYAVHGFTVLEEANDIVDADACAFDDGVASPHARLARDIAVTDTCNVSIHSFKITLS